MPWQLGNLRGRDRRTAASFVSTEGPKLHQGLGGSSQYDPAQGQFVDPKPYRHLEEAMKQYVPSHLGIQFSNDAWDDLFEKICGTESETEEKNRNVRRLFWYKMGNKREHILPWLALIPDAYGLEVIKAAVALVLKLAEDSVEKREKIFEAFVLLRNTLINSMSKRKSFRGDPIVSECANTLYVTLVGAIEDLILFAAPQRSAWRRWIPRFEHSPNPQDPDVILRKVAEKATALENAVGQTRDAKIESTERLSKNTNAQLTYVRQDVKSTEVNTRETLGKLDNQHKTLEKQQETLDRVDDQVLHVRSAMKRREKRDDKFLNLVLRQEQKLNRIAENENKLMAAQLQSRNFMLDMVHVLLEDRDNMSAIILELQQQTRKPAAVVSPERLLTILAGSRSSPTDMGPMETIIRHPADDLERALFQRNRFKQSTQAQAQSLLRHSRFVKWLSESHPDMIFVEGNIASAALDKLSVVSVFCATLVASMIKVKPHEVIVHFFCGLHTTSNDIWHGPNGLIRSIIVQLLVKLASLDILSLDFINDREYLRDLEAHDLPSLCETLHELIYQFPPDMTVYCVVDGISSFDKNKMFDNLATVISTLKGIVRDRYLPAIFKVLITTPKSCSMRIKRLLDPSDLVMLASSNIFPTEISNKLVEARLLRHSTSEVPRLDDVHPAEDIEHGDENLEGYETN